MTASFDKQELMAGLAELEKRVREHRPSNERPPAAAGDRLDIDLAAIEAALKAKRGVKPAADAAPSVEPPREAQRSSRKLDVAPEPRVSSRAKEGSSVPTALEALTLRVESPRDPVPPSRSATIGLVAQKDPKVSTSAKGSLLGAIAIENATRIAGDWTELPPPPPPERIDSAAKANFIPVAGPEAAAPAPTASAPKRPHRWIYAAAAMVIVVGTLVGGAGWLVTGKVLAALKDSSKSAPKVMAAAPALEVKTEAASAATPVAAEETASAAPAAAVEATPAEPVALSAATVAEAPAQAMEAAAAPAPAQTAAVALAPSTAAALASSAPAASAPSTASAPPPPPAKAVAAVEQPPAAAPAPTSDAPADKPAKPAKKPKKATADKSEDKATDKDSGSKSHAKPKPEKVAKPHAAPETSAPLPPPQPQALAAPPPPPPPPVAANPDSGMLARAGQAVGSITGTVKGWVGLDSGAHAQ